MRFLLSIAAWVVFVGGLFCYTAWRDARVDAESTGDAGSAAVAVEENFAIEITTTFALEEDPFALRTESGGEAPLELHLNGRPVPVPIDRIRHGQPLTLDGIEGVVRGRNEVHVKASPPAGDNALDNCVRIRLLENGVAVADGTVWGSRGALVSGTLPFTITEEEREHDH